MERNLSIVIDVTQLLVSRADTGIERVVRRVIQEAFDLEIPKPVLVSTSWVLGRNRFEIVSIDAVRSSQGSEQNNKNLYSSAGYKWLTGLRRWLERKRLNFLVQNRLSIFLANLFLSMIQSLEIKNAGKIYKFSNADTLVLPGAFWSKKSLRLAQHAVRSGARLAVIINDVTPLSHPQFCDAPNRRNFSLFASRILSLADMVLYPSNHTKTQVEIFWPGILNGKKLKKLNYGHDFLNLNVSKVHSDRIPNSICVLGTIEPRKNHEVVLQWFMAFPDSKTTLTFIGRPGWLTETFQESLIEQSKANASLRWLHSLSDQEVAGELSKHELGVLASHEEGFGLPVVEMSAAGLKLVLSDIPIFREVAGESAEYFAKDSIVALNEAIIRARQKERAPAIMPYLWKDTARDLFEFIGQGESKRS